MITSQLTTGEYRPNIFEHELGYIAHAMFVMIEIRDPYTAIHQQRVAQLAATIAKKIGFLKPDVINLYMTGMLHDIGKLAVPIEILSKPSKLTQFEFSLIQSHSGTGSDMLTRVGFPPSVTQVVLQHHERLNGSGYPQGLSGKNIAPEARILAIADVVEAMASHRPYRPALGLDRALEEINQKKGILYDIDVVETCNALFLNNEPEFLRIMALAENTVMYPPLFAPV